jgi:hypothetical protein
MRAAVRARTPRLGFSRIVSAAVWRTGGRGRTHRPDAPRRRGDPDLCTARMGASVSACDHRQRGCATRAQRAGNASRAPPPPSRCFARWVLDGSLISARGIGVSTLASDEEKGSGPWARYGLDVGPIATLAKGRSPAPRGEAPTVIEGMRVSRRQRVDNPPAGLPDPGCRRASGGSSARVFLPCGTICAFLAQGCAFASFSGWQRRRLLVVRRELADPGGRGNGDGAQGHESCSGRR